MPKHKTSSNVIFDETDSLSHYSGLKTIKKSADHDLRSLKNVCELEKGMESPHTNWKERYFSKIEPG